MKEVFGYWRWNWSFSSPYQIIACKLYGSGEVATRSRWIHSVAIMRWGLGKTLIFFWLSLHTQDLSLWLAMPYTVFVNAMQFVIHRVVDYEVESSLDSLALIRISERFGLKTNWWINNGNKPSGTLLNSNAEHEMKKSY